MGSKDVVLCRRSEEAKSGVNNRSPRPAPGHRVGAHGPGHRPTRSGSTATSGTRVGTASVLCCPLKFCFCFPTSLTDTPGSYWLK